MSNMFAFGIIFILLFILEILYFKIADNFNIIDKPNQRSSHTQVTLRGGGIIFLFGMWVYCMFYGLTYPYFMIGLTAIAGISFVDDIKSVPNKVRLVIQFTAMILMFQNLGILEMDKWWIVLIAIIICVGIINAYNFMDGINGITGAYSIAVLLPLIYINYDIHFIDNNYIVVALIGVIIFNFFNFRKKAKCFAGDVGSVGIAFIILFALGKLILHTENISYMLFLSVYGADSILTIVHRIKLRENIGLPHRKHMYQLMANELKVPHVFVSSIYMFTQMIISFGLLLIPINNWIYFSAVVAVLMLVYIVFMKKYYYLHQQYIDSKK